jgi:hypothetical protein
VLASIPYIRNTRDKRRHALMLSSFAAAYSLAVVVMIAVIISTRHR